VGQFCAQNCPRVGQFCALSTSGHAARNRPLASRLVDRESYRNVPMGADQCLRTVYLAKYSRCTNTPIASSKTCCRPCIKLSKEACARVTRRDCVCHGAQPAQSHGCNPFCKPAFGQKSRSMRTEKRNLKYSILRLSYLPSSIKKDQNVLNKSLH